MTAETIALPAPVAVGSWWRRYRWPAALGAALLGFAVVLAVIANAPPQRPLDPTDASPVGGQALAELLRARGVTVTTVATAASAPAGATVFVPDPTSQTRADLAALADRSATVVVVAPTDRETEALGVDVHVSGATDDTTVGPGCALPAATTAGAITFTGRLYAGDAVDQCYPHGSGAGLVTAATSGGRAVVFGSPTTLMNASLDDEGNAALGLGLLDVPHVVWVTPAPPTTAPADTKRRSFWELVGPRVHWGVAAAVLAVLVLALARGRRLGPVVPEPLPVIVRATETVEGRGRLLRAAGARGRAAAALRNAAVIRLSRLLRLPPSSSPVAVRAAVADHADVDPGRIEALLYGADPHDDRALVELAAALDELEHQVRN